MIFRFKHVTEDKDMVKVFMHCDGEGDADSFFADDEVYIGIEGTSEEAKIIPSTQEEIDLLNSLYE